jgi:hypothetical protein
MREEKILIRIFRKVGELIGEEANRNPEFAAKLDAIVTELPARRKAPGTKKPTTSPSDLPDIFAEWKARPQSDFILWLKDQPSVVLRAEIKAHEFDPTGRTRRWKDTEKLAHFIAEQMRTRATRGSAFLIANPPFPSQ